MGVNSSLQYVNSTVSSKLFSRALPRAPWRRKKESSIKVVGGCRSTNGQVQTWVRGRQSSSSKPDNYFIMAVVTDFSHCLSVQTAMILGTCNWNIPRMTFTCFTSLRINSLRLTITGLFFRATSGHKFHSHNTPCSSWPHSVRMNLHVWLHAP